MEIGPVDENHSVPPSVLEKRRPAANMPGGIFNDRVEISENARAKLAELADQALTEQYEPHDGTRAGPQREAEDTRSHSSASARHSKLAEVRKRIRSGFYDQTDVKKEIADRLADDIDP
jgi:hypothetical protein